MRGQSPRARDSDPQRCGRNDCCKTAFISAWASICIRPGPPIEASQGLLQVRVAPALIRLQVIPLGPLVPGVDKHQALVAAIASDRVVDSVVKPPPIKVRPAV